MLKLFAAFIAMIVGSWYLSALTFVFWWGALQSMWWPQIPDMPMSTALTLSVLFMLWAVAVAFVWKLIAKALVALLAK